MPAGPKPAQAPAEPVETLVLYDDAGHALPPLGGAGFLRLLADLHRCTAGSFATICREIQARMSPRRGRFPGVLRDRPEDTEDRS